MKNEIIIHIPHSSYVIPKEYENLFYHSAKDLFFEQLRMADSFTDELFDIDNITKLVFPISRLICDVERFRNEDDEEMTKQGMWVCYTLTSDLKPLKRVTEEHKKEILNKYYDKHHHYFEQLTEKKLKESGRCLIIDAHSFASEKLPYELHGENSRPDICIGTDKFHTPDYIADYLFNSFVELGYSVAVNNPFCGTIVPLKYYGKNKNVMSVMIELNRSLYMDENSGIKTDKFLVLKNDLKKIVCR